MNGRLRTLTALAALFALTVYFGESVLASWCMPAGPVASSVHAGEAAAPGHPDVHQHGSSGSSPESHHPDAPTPTCQLGMAGGGSCVAASLPSPQETMRSAPATLVGALSLSDPSPDLLLVASPFRPPQA
jgi:hypothetical protein